MQKSNIYKFSLLLVIVLASCKPAPIPIGFPKSQSQYYTYLPLVFSSNQSILGVNTYESTRRANPYLVPGGSVLYSISWSDTETVQGVYDWVKSDYQLELLDRQQHRLIIGVRNTPVWARTIPTYQCSAPQLQYYDKFHAFLLAIIERYSPDKIEIWNEPDVPTDIPIHLTSYLGCWGTDFASGAAFGSFVEQVSEGIATPIMAGGFCLCHPGDFLAGYLLINPDIEYISFHGYAHYQQNDWDAIFLQSDRISRATDLQQFVTETSLLGDVVGEEQAEYLQYIHKTAQDYPISGLLWFTMNNSGWEYADMIKGGVERPVWYIYQEILAPFGWYN